MDKPMITSRPGRDCWARPVVAGTRITVELILRTLGAGESIDQLLDSHPRRDPRGGLGPRWSLRRTALGAEIVRPVTKQSA